MSSSAINTPKSHRSDKINCDERRSSVSKALQCDRTPTRTKNWLVMKRDLQCDKCGNIRSICDDTDHSDNRSASFNAKETSCHFSDEHFNTNHFNDTATFKSTNCKHKSESTYSLGRSSSFINSTDIHLTIRRRIVYAQVLLEAFGNASISLNSNSSRFVSWPHFWSSIGAGSIFQWFWFCS